MIRIGISAGANTPQPVFDAADYVEIKKITPEETAAIRSITEKPLFFHLQYARSGQYLLPTAMSFEDLKDDFHAAGHMVNPEQVSLHFGLAASKITLDSKDCFAVALEPPLPKERILNTLEENLLMIRESFPWSKVLLENLEFIPEHLCRGAYRYVQEAPFFSRHVNRWRENGLVDGIVFDIAHALIVSGNHPLYNGLSRESPGHKPYRDPLETDEGYIAELSKRSSENLLVFFRGYIDQMPLPLIREIHISGIQRADSGVYVDAHNEISSLELQALDTLMNHRVFQSRDSVPITLEYSRDAGRIVPQIQILRGFLGSRQNTDS